MSESKFTAGLAALMRRLGFAVWTVNQTRRKPIQQVDPGVADIIAFGHGVTLFVETKVDRNKQSVPQEEFERAAKGNGSLYWVIRSEDELLSCGKALGWWR